MHETEVSRIDSELRNMTRADADHVRNAASSSASSGHDEAQIGILSFISICNN